MSNLNAIRELLLKKAQGNGNLQTVISVIKDELLTDKLLESLEKMAKPQATMGRSANAGVTAFGNQMKNKDVEMMRDALSHHVSHYKSALKNNQREIADQHLEKIIPLMHLAGKAAAHSGGQLGLDYVPLEPWETNYTTPERIQQGAERGTPGKLKEGTKGLRRRLNSVSRDKNPRSVPNYHYLEMNPHEEHADVHTSPHKGGYPFEEIQLGNPAKIDAKEAHLHIEDPGKQDAFTPHPFDAHPVHEIADLSQGDLSENHMNNFVSKMNDWHGSEHNTKWMQDIKQKHSANPEGFKARGKQKPSHHFEGLPLQKQPHASSKPATEATQSSAPVATPSVSANKVQEAAPTTPAVSSKDISHLPAALRAKFGGGK